MSVDDLGYDPVKRALRNLKSGAEQRRKILDMFFEHTKKSPEELVLLARKTPYGVVQFEIEDMVSDYLKWRDDSDNASSTIAKEANYIRSFFSSNYIIITTPNKYELRAVYESKAIPTQDGVRKMIEVTEKLEEKAVICILAQTGQRVGILTGLRFSMIKYTAKQEDGRIYGIVTVPPEIEDRRGHPAGNKGGNLYQFGLHWESVSLLDEMEKKHGEKERFIWDFDKRRMQGIVTSAAKRAGIQKTTFRKLKSAKGKSRKWNEVHAHVFRRYWIARMVDAKVMNPYLLNYQLGHVIPDITYWWGLLTEENILDAMKQADEQLRVLPIDRPTMEHE